MYKIFFFKKSVTRQPNDPLIFKLKTIARDNLWKNEIRILYLYAFNRELILHLKALRLDNFRYPLQILDPLPRHAMCY